MVRKNFGSFEEVLSSVARRKRDAAKARFNGSEPGAEKPRQVFLAACETVASTFVPNGFRYSRSKQAFQSNVGAFSYQISFQSSHNNIAGQHVVMWMHANVRCSQLASWRSQQPNPLRRDDWVAGGMIHLLTNEHAMIEWELADPRHREDTLADAIGFVRSVVLPYFGMFMEPSLTIAEVMRRRISAFRIGDQIEFALCFAEPRAALEILRRFVAERPDLHDQMRRAIDRVARNGLPDFPPTGYADVVAWVGDAYGLKVGIG